MIHVAADLAEMLPWLPPVTFVQARRYHGYRRRVKSDFGLSLFSNIEDFCWRFFFFPKINQNEISFSHSMAFDSESTLHTMLRGVKMRPWKSPRAILVITPSD